MKQLLLLLVAASFIAGCKEKKATAETPVTTEIAAPVTADSAAIRTLITDFYTWYTGHYESMMQFKLYNGTGKPDQPPYRINWAEVDRYQAFIRDSVPYLGAAFLENQKKMFRQCDSAFKVDVKDEIPYGFDYDWYTNSQEDPAYLLNGIKASGKWIISVKNEEANVEIGAPEDKNYVSGSLLLYVGLKKENGQWKIAQIGND